MNGRHFELPPQNISPAATNTDRANIRSSPGSSARTARTVSGASNAALRKACLPMRTGPGGVAWDECAFRCNFSIGARRDAVSLAPGRGEHHRRKG